VLSESIGEILITDPSPAFCRITAAKLSKLSPPPPNAQIAVLAAEDIRRLPKNVFSLIALRSTLHHILDVRQFFFDCADVLAPGGLILFEEPCYEGYVLMGAITQFMPEILKANGVRISEKHLADIQLFSETMRFYARRDLDKSACEDKHLFRLDELMRICDDCGLRLEHFPNRVFANIERRNEPLEANYFEQFYYDYMKYALAWDQDLTDVVWRYGKKYLEYLSPLTACGAAPYMYGTFLCKKVDASSKLQPRRPD
jgi:SAM-dependent methyltransferase